MAKSLCFLSRFTATLFALRASAFTISERSYAGVTEDSQAPGWSWVDPWKEMELTKVEEEAIDAATYDTYTSVLELITLIAEGPVRGGKPFRADGLPQVYKDPQKILACLASRKYVMFVGDSNSRMLTVEVLLKLLSAASGPTGGKLRIEDVAPVRSEACLFHNGSSPCDWNWVHADREFFVSEQSAGSDAARPLLRISFRFIHSEEDALSLFVNHEVNPTEILRDFDGSTNYLENHDAIIRTINLNGFDDSVSNARRFKREDLDQLRAKFPSEPTDIFFAQSLWFLTPGRLSRGCKSPDCSAVTSIMHALAKWGPRVYWSNWGSIPFRCKGVREINDCTASAMPEFKDRISYVDMMQLTGREPPADIDIHYEPWTMVAWLQTLLGRSCSDVS